MSTLAPLPAPKPCRQCGTPTTVHCDGAPFCGEVCLRRYLAKHLGKH